MSQSPLPHASTLAQMVLNGDGDSPSDDHSSKSGIFSELAQLDRAIGRCRSHIGQKFGGTPYIGTRQPPLSVMDPSCLDIFIPPSGDGQSCEEAVKGYYSGGFVRYANMKGMEAIDDGCIDMFQKITRTVVFKKHPGEQMGDIIVEDCPNVQYPALEQVEVDFDTYRAKSTPGGDRKRRRIADDDEPPAYTPPPNAPALTEEMRKANESVLSRDNKDLIRVIGPHQMFRENLATLKLQEWLDDRVIDAYLNLIKERNQQRGLRKMYTFASTFYALLGTSKGLDKVREAANGDNIFNYDILLIPVCKSSHWRLIVVDVQARSIRSYNSLGTPDAQIRNNIERFLASEEVRLANGVPRNPAAPGWHLDKEKVPRQNNDYDCGVFVLQFANYISRGQPIDFSQANMNYFREMILYECVEGRLLL